MDFIITVLAFLFAIGVLVAVHEFGHFWVARKLGIKVLRFAIGFGKPLISYKSNDIDKTEYALAAIPLGGYVKMLDEREGEVEPHEVDRAFNRQPVWKRFLIVLAGPMFNFIFAIFAFAAMHMMGVDAVRPYLGNVQPDSPAAVAGFEHKDKIIAINDVDIASMSQARLVLLNEYLKDSRVTVHVETEKGSHASRTLDLKGISLLKDESDYFAKTGLSFWQPPHQPVIMQVMKDSAAESAGLQIEDRVLEMDGQAVISVEQFSSYINSNANKAVKLKISRASGQTELSITPRLTTREGQTRGLIGVSLARDITDEDRQALLFKNHASFLPALKKGVIDTWDMSVMTVKVMGRLIMGEASIKNISGPITIANYAGKSALVGISVFISFLAIVSLSLGVLNLMPIPLLDGGHLLYYMVEMIKGSPVSEKVEAIGMRIGMSVVGILMVLAIYNDITRLMG